jgi:hypothetical protein
MKNLVLFVKIATLCIVFCMLGCNNTEEIALKPDYSTHESYYIEEIIVIDNGNETICKNFDEVTLYLEESGKLTDYIKTKILELQKEISYVEKMELWKESNDSEKVKNYLSSLNEKRNKFDENKNLKTSYIPTIVYENINYQGFSMALGIPIPFFPTPLDCNISSMYVFPITILFTERYWAGRAKMYIGPKSVHGLGSWDNVARSAYIF